ncbi:MAG TPA: thiamine pyrophosphate-binding protein [Polyangiaceae bacterium]|nr:thiamine pyrophosphate-binding protein [Polyangiaceae bacterium]
MLVRDVLVEQFVRLGVRHVFGVGGANIEDLFSAVQARRPEIRAVLCKHEHAAGTAADAYARLRGFGVVMATSGGGAMNLVHSLAEARASHVPVLAIVGEPPTELQGRGAFQDTSGKGNTLDARLVFQAATGRAVRLGHPGDLPAALDSLLDGILGASAGPGVLLVAKDFQRAEVTAAPRWWRKAVVPVVPAGNELDAAVRNLESRSVVVLAGAEVARAGARRQLAELVERLDARVATTPDGRDAFANGDGRFLGVVGGMGHPAVNAALAEAETVLVVGTRLPLLARQGAEGVLRERTLVSVGHDPPYVRGLANLHVGGDLALALGALARRLGRGSAASAPRAPVEAGRTEVRPDARLTASVVLRLVNEAANGAAVILADAGNTGATAAHELAAPADGRYLMAMGMAGMGYTFGAATGAACATGKRVIAVAGDGAFFMNGLEIHTAVEHELPITYVLLNNRAHGMCLVRERLLLNENAGYNAFRPSRLGAGLATMFPGLRAFDCDTAGELAERLLEAGSSPGPAVVVAELDEVEVPPFAAFQARDPDAKTVEREPRGP